MTQRITNRESTYTGATFSIEHEKTWEPKWPAGSQTSTRRIGTGGKPSVSMLRLMPLKQFAVGGRYGVRGYRENQLVRDNGLLPSLEAHLPVIRESRFAQHVPVAPFVDFGHVWSTSTPTPNPKTLACIGLGLPLAATVPTPFAVRPQFKVFWGVPLNNVKTPGGNLQD